MMKGLYLHAESTPLPIKQPVPLKACFQTSIKILKWIDHGRLLICLNVRYTIKNISTKRRHGWGTYGIIFEIQMDREGVEPVELYEVVECAITNLGIEINRFYHLPPAIYCINYPSFKKMQPALAECSDWFKNAIKEKRATKQ